MNLRIWQMLINRLHTDLSYIVLPTEINKFIYMELAVI